VENDFRIHSLLEDDFLFCEFSLRLYTRQNEKGFIFEDFFSRKPCESRAEADFPTGTS